MKTWKEVVEKDKMELELKLGDATDRSRWKAKDKRYWCDSNYRGDKILV